jgi:ribokinase
MILVFGSINLDLIFPMEALPRPGETLLAKGFRTEPGGKGANQAVAAARDGVQVAMYGAVGRDAFAGPALAGLRAVGVDLAGVESVDAPTGVASIVTDAAGRNSIAVAPGANLFAKHLRIADQDIEQKSIIIVQMECSRDETCELIRRAAARGARVVLNLAPASKVPEDVLSKTHLVVVNEDEARFLSAQLDAPADAQAISRKLGVGVVRTLGAAGCEFADGDRLVRCPGHRVDVVDTIAAGDCFVGVLAAALDRGASIEPALRRANAAAALACTRSGSQSSLPDAAEIDAALRFWKAQ